MAGGRPKAVIDWVIVDAKLEAGCSGAEVAAFLGLDKKTIYERCVTDKEMPFSEYLQHKRAKGESLLREKQFHKAMGYTDTGDNTLLIWLGKQRLKQTDIKAKDIENTVDNYLDRIKTKDFSKDDYKPKAVPGPGGKEQPVEAESERADKVHDSGTAARNG